MITKILLVAGLFASASLSPVLARDAVIGLSASQEPEALKKQVELVIGHLTETLKPGETAQFFDATGVKLIATFKAPSGKGVGNPRYMLNANRPALGQLKAFIERAKALPGRIGQINLPSLMETIMRYYPAGDKGKDFIVLGSPVTDLPDAPSLSMRDGRVPNDGHIATSSNRSLYGAKGGSGSLAQYDLYFGDTVANWAVSESHRYYMERFWSLEAEARGGSMAYFGHDLNTLFTLAGRDVPNRKHRDPLVPTDKLEMLQFERDDTKVPDFYEQPLKQDPAPEPVWRAARNPRIGITWDVPKADLDLYVRPNPTAQVIFFQQLQTAEGRLYKDFRKSPVNGFETVALNGVYDLSNTRIAVNFYGGTAPAGKVSGELRIVIGNDVWAKRFAIDMSEGNKGDGAKKVIVEGKVPNKAWIIIDSLKVLTKK